VKRRLAATLALASLVGSGIARADPKADEARAEALFEEAKALRGAGRVAEACADFEESRRLDEGIGVTLYLADCYQQAGDPRRARREFRRAQALAIARGDARADVAGQRADAIERGGASELPIVPGPTPTPAGADGASPTPPGADGATPAPSTRRWIGIGTMATGAVGLGVGAVFGILALSKLGQSNDGPCGANDRCNATGLDLRRQSGEAATVSTIGFAAGAAALAGGVAIYLTTPRRTRDGKGVAVTPSVGPGGAGLALAGRF
jgi:hypothetical protein